MLVWDGSRKKGILILNDWHVKLSIFLRLAWIFEASFLVWFQQFGVVVGWALVVRVAASKVRSCFQCKTPARLERRSLPKYVCLQFAEQFLFARKNIPFKSTREREREREIYKIITHHLCSSIVTSSGFHTESNHHSKRAKSWRYWKNSLNRLTKVVVMLQQRRFEDLCAALERYGKLDVAYWVCAFSATCAQHFRLLQWCYQLQSLPRFPFTTWCPLSQAVQGFRAFNRKKLDGFHHYNMGARISAEPCKMTFLHRNLWYFSDSKGQSADLNLIPWPGESACWDLCQSTSDRLYGISNSSLQLLHREAFSRRLLWSLAFFFTARILREKVVDVFDPWSCWCVSPLPRKSADIRFHGFWNPMNPGFPSLIPVSSNLRHMFNHRIRQTQLGLARPWTD